MILPLYTIQSKRYLGLGADWGSISISPANISTNATNNFSIVRRFNLKSQILNLNRSNDTSVSAEVGNPGFSKRQIAGTRKGAAGSALV